jgi:DNA primase
MTAIELFKQNESIVDISRRLHLDIKKEDGKKAISVCPFCGDESGHLYLYRESNRFYCFKCRKSGDLIDLYGLVKSIPQKDAIRELLDIYHYRDGYKPRSAHTGHKMEASEPITEQQPPPARFKQLYYDAITYMPLTESGRNYMHGRGIGNKIIDRYGIGGIDTSTEVTRRLRESHDLDTLIESGLFSLSKNGKPYFTFYLPAIVFPHFDSGITMVTALSTRNLAGDVKCFKLHDQPTRLYYGDISGSRDIFIFEGIISALSYAELTGKHNFIALGGLITPGKYESLRMIHPNHNLILALDPDEAGEKALAEIRQCTYINWKELCGQMGLKGVPTHPDGKKWDMNDLLMHDRGLLK